MVSRDWHRFRVCTVFAHRNASVEPALGKATEAVLRVELLLPIGIVINTYITFFYSWSRLQNFFNSLIAFAK